MSANSRGVQRELPIHPLHISLIHASVRLASPVLLALALSLCCCVELTCFLRLRSDLLHVRDGVGELGLSGVESRSGSQRQGEAQGGGGCIRTTQRGRRRRRWRGRGGGGRRCGCARHAAATDERACCRVVARLLQRRRCLREMNVFAISISGSGSVQTCADFRARRSSLESHASPVRRRSRLRRHSADAATAVADRCSNQRHQSARQHRRYERDQSIAFVFPRAQR